MEMNYTQLIEFNINIDISVKIYYAKDSHKIIKPKLSEDSDGKPRV
jgi:hypothetical protein